MPSFDVVSQVDLQEVRNAVDQASRELVQRFDFRGTDSKVSLGDAGITVESDSEGRLDAANDVLKSKLIRRSIDLRSIGDGEAKQIGGGRYRSLWTLNQGISKEAAKELTKLIRDSGLKVQAQVQGDQVRIQGKKRDDLQAAIAELKELDFELPLQFINFRD
jgi:uncharacterized protein YajQ (UPF0234 family)